MRSRRRNPTSRPGAPSAGLEPGSGSSHYRTPSPRLASRFTRSPRPWSRLLASRPTRSRCATRAAASALPSSSRMVPIARSGSRRGELVRQRGAEETREPLPGADPLAATALGDFYGLACSALEQLRADDAEGDPSLLQLWPEHFDIAIELGDEAAGQRANFGASPGDDGHEEPYLYVSPWTREISGELWNATGLAGAELSYSELIAADDQRGAALSFWRERYRAL